MSNFRVDHIKTRGGIVHHIFQRKYCFQCRHFRNSPEYLETVFKGMTSLSSAHGSVRAEDGICLRHDLYLAANRSCDHFEPYPSSPERRAAAQ